MKRLIAYAALCVLPAVSFAAEPTQVVADFAAALETGDKERALAILDPNVVIFEGGYVERSRAEYAHHHLGGDIEFARAVKRKVLKVAQHVEGDTAVVWEESETTGNFKGKDVHSFGTGTALLVRKAGNWSITHIHWSSRKAK